MGKGLEALQRLFDNNYGNNFYIKAEEDAEIIEKELKALKIIIEKKVNIALLLEFMERYEDDDELIYKYNRWWEYPLTLDEYKSIKEIINDYK